MIIIFIIYIIIIIIIIVITIIIIIIIIIISSIIILIQSSNKIFHTRFVVQLINHFWERKFVMFAVGILKLAGDIRFELMMTISKTVALDQARRIPNKFVL